MRSVITLFAISLLAACSVVHEGRASLANSTWRFVSIDGEPPASGKAQLTFEDDRIGANVGCNGMGGPWRVEAGRLIAGPLAQTQMYCEGAVWDQEKALGALLAGAPELDLKQGKLLLKSSGHSAELHRAN